MVIITECRTSLTRRTDRTDKDSVQMPVCSSGICKKQAIHITTVYIGLVIISTSLTLSHILFYFFTHCSVKGALLVAH